MGLRDATPQRAKTLNTTLKTIVTIFNKNDFNSWFIAYGTLLGSIRENSCVEYDDDIDIVVDKKDALRLRELLELSPFQILEGVEKRQGFEQNVGIIKTKQTNTYSSIDFYLAEVSETGDYNDEWEKVNWTQCTPFVVKEWEGVLLNLPQNAVEKISKRYPNWKTPTRKKQGGKGINRPL